MRAFVTPRWPRQRGFRGINLSSGAVTLLSGPPLLTRIAVESAKAFGPIQGDTNLDVTYHFVLVDTAASVVTSTTVQRRNAFERAVLRMLGLKTQKAAIDYLCQEGVPPANDLKLAGAVIEIWIYGRTRCIQTEPATFVAKR